MHAPRRTTTPISMETDHCSWSCSIDIRVELHGRRREVCRCGGTAEISLTRRRTDHPPPPFDLIGRLYPCAFSSYVWRCLATAPGKKLRGLKSPAMEVPLFDAIWAASC